MKASYPHMIGDDSAVFCALSSGVVVWQGGACGRRVEARRNH